MKRLRMHILVLIACTVLAAPGALAQTDPGKVAAARQLGFDGIKDYQAGAFADASDKLERAYALVKAPTIGLWSARALAKLGRLVAAEERYLETTRLPLPTTNRDNHQKAQEDAVQEREALLTRIPSLRVDVSGAPAAEVELSMDGVAVDSSLIGAARPVDPGKHHLVAKWKGQEQAKDLELAESANQSAALAFEPEPTPPRETEPIPAPISFPYRPVPPPPSEDRVERRGSNTLAYVAFGVGGVGLVAGTITGVMAMGKKNDLEDSKYCRDGKCGPEAHADVDSLNRLRTFSTIGFVVGAVGVSAGVTLFLTNTKKEASKPSARAALRLGPGYVGLAGRF